MELKNKKLLILGGSAISSDIVKTAKEMGIYTIVTDWYDENKSPAKKIANEHYEISIKDYDSLLKLIKEKNIDGIITGFTDSYLESYVKICKLADLPCYATEDQFLWSLDKSKFKNKCRKYGIAVVDEYLVADILALGYLPCEKIILKPVDNSGSRGIIKVDNYNDFKRSLAESLEYSPKKHVLAERFMDCDDVSLCYTIRNGKINLSAFCDRYLHRSSSGGSVTSCLIYPSIYLSDYLKETDMLVRKMFEAEDLSNGVLFMQAFVENSKFYFYEMGYRLSGGRHYIFTKAENDVSAIKELILFAISGHMDIEAAEKDNADFTQMYSQLSILCDSQRIGSFEGIDFLRENPNIIDYSLYYNVGDMVGLQGTTMQIVARIHIKAKDKSELIEVINKIRINFKVNNTEGQNIVIDSTFSNIIQ